MLIQRFTYDPIGSIACIHVAHPQVDHVKDVPSSDGSVVTSWQLRDEEEVEWKITTFVVFHCILNGEICFHHIHPRPQMRGHETLVPLLPAKLSYLLFLIRHESLDMLVKFFEDISSFW